LLLGASAGIVINTTGGPLKLAPSSNPNINPAQQSSASVFATSLTGRLNHCQIDFLFDSEGYAWMAAVIHNLASAINHLRNTKQQHTNTHRILNHRHAPSKSSRRHGGLANRRSGALEQA
jgi:hypothetical protein